MSVKTYIVVELKLFTLLCIARHLLHASPHLFLFLGDGVLTIRSNSSIVKGCDLSVGTGGMNGKLVVDVLAVSGGIWFGIWLGISG